MKPCCSSGAMLCCSSFRTYRRRLRRRCRTLSHYDDRPTRRGLISIPCASGVPAGIRGWIAPRKTLDRRHRVRRARARGGEADRTKEATADPGARDAQTGNPASLTEIAPTTTTESPPPTAERATPKQKPPAEPPQEVKPASPAPAAAPPPARTSQPPAQPTVKPAPSEPDARAAVLARLRRRPGSRHGIACHVGRTASTGADRAAAAPPRQRLLDARTALAAGRLGEAEKLLQQAQIQLVLRPTTPSQDVSFTGSVAGGGGRGPHHAECRQRAACHALHQSSGGTG